MNMIGKSAVAAVTLLGLASGIATAAPAFVERDSNVRQGPGTNYPVQGLLQQGTVVEVDECRNGWCAVYSDQPGFVAQSLLSFGEGPMARYEAAPMRSRIIVEPSYGYYDALPPGYYSDGYYPRRRYGSGFGFGFEF